MCQLLISCLGFLFVVISFVACMGAFVLPYWVYCPSGCSGVTNGGSFLYEGMLVRMTDQKYWTYFWEDDFKMEQDLPGVRIFGSKVLNDKIDKVGDLTKKRNVQVLLIQAKVASAREQDMEIYKKKVARVTRRTAELKDLLKG
ncbi:hypothetical protein HELRODRAFT_176040 [Helobdella robusta]|uniref:Uncharacterized protein n=1 Tax=Helobdella robusta TaxID=6412 RepID=T1FA26_HELRO|nr:hypothetical protein HELRODRAFT_176040 [Helobdella robusta]ESO00203.1 hypothetical protein HELRODRAFT_176040 [Helobdella robusta]